MKRKIATAADVTAWRMCLGCGACSSVCPQHRIVLRDILDQGIRPVLMSEIPCESCGKCLEVCPGIEMKNDTADPDAIRELRPGWGTILGLYEGYAADPDLRFNGSSGGVANALALFCLEKLGMSGVVHTRAHESEPWRNRTVFSNDRKGISAAAGSRYSPASPAEGISRILAMQGLSVFIGKPCDVAAHYKATRANPALAEKTGCTIGIFCAGTPSTDGTLELLKSMGIDPANLEELRYRGRGWPGMFAVRPRGSESLDEKMTYADSWGFIQKYRSLRCYHCPDGTSEFADISCGDPWHKKAEPGQHGISLVLARTRRGRTILEQAVGAGYLVLETTSPRSLVQAQKNLLDKRSWIWGRIAGLRMLGLPAPVLKGFHLFPLWIKAPAGDKLRSLYGTVRRALQRKYYQPLRTD